ncbi:hypothetical protein ABFS83_10G060300 [Erythranthe nasuta]
MVRPQSSSKRSERREGRYKGVRMRKWGKWVAEVRQPNSRDRIWLGSYDTAEEAARAYDAAVVCLRGSSSVLNFPDDPPDVISADGFSRSQIQVAASKHARRSAAGAAAPAVADVELKQSLVGSLLLGEKADLGSSSFGEFHGGGGGYLKAEEKGRGGSAGAGGDDVIGGGVFFDTPRVWNF